MSLRTFARRGSNAPRTSLREAAGRRTSLRVAAKKMGKNLALEALAARIQEVAIRVDINLGKHNILQYFLQ